MSTELIPRGYKVTFYDLDYLAGTWTEKDKKTFDENVKPFEIIDKETLFQEDMLVTHPPESGFVGSYSSSWASAIRASVMRAMAATEEE